MLRSGYAYIVVVCMMELADIQRIVGYIFIDFKQTLTEGMVG